MIISQSSSIKEKGKRELPELIRQQLMARNFSFVKKITLVIFICSLSLIITDKPLITEISFIFGKKQTTARVTRVIRHTKTLSNVYYRFVLRGARAYKGETRVGNDKLKTGDVLTVVYNPSFPSLNKQVGTFKASIISALILVALAFTLWFSSKYDFFTENKRRLRIAEEGVFTNAIIKQRFSKKEVAEGKKDYRYYIVFKSDAEKIQQEYFVSKRKFDTNIPLLVIYLPHSPSRFFVVDDLPAAAQRFFKLESGQEDIIIHI